MDIVTSSYRDYYCDRCHRARGQPPESESVTRSASAQATIRTILMPVTVHAWQPEAIAANFESSSTSASRPPLRHAAVCGVRKTVPEWPASVASAASVRHWCFGARPQATQQRANTGIHHRQHHHCHHHCHRRHHHRVIITESSSSHHRVISEQSSESSSSSGPSHHHQSMEFYENVQQSSSHHPIHQ